MKEVFISYSTVDTVQAETVRNILEKNGVSCWMAPRDIPGGSNYTKEIPIAIRGCKAFVLILSKNAQNSQWVLRELDSAVNNGKVILPFMLEDCALNDEFNFLLTGAQRYAAYQKKAEALEKLVGRVRAVLDADSQSAAEPVAPENLQQKQAPATSYMAECPVCGSSELTLQPNKVVKRDLIEYLLGILSPVMGIIVAFVGMFVTIFIDIETVFLALLIGFVGGCILGNLLAKKIIRTRRLRMRKKVECYRCSRCNKLFNYIEEL